MYCKMPSAHPFYSCNKSAVSVSGHWMPLILTHWALKCQQPRGLLSKHISLQTANSLCLASVSPWHCFHLRKWRLWAKTPPRPPVSPSIHSSLPLCSLNHSLSTPSSTSFVRSLVVSALVSASWGLRRSDEEAGRLRGRTRARERKRCRRENGNDSFVGQAFCGKGRKVTEGLRAGGWEIERWSARESDRAAQQTVGKTLCSSSDHTDIH